MSLSFFPPQHIMAFAMLTGQLDRAPLDNLPINAQGPSLGTSSAPTSSISSRNAPLSFDSASTTLVLTSTTPPDTLRQLQEDVPQLSPEQSAVLNRVMRGENVFFTGAAGTGKSVLLRAIVAEFKKREEAELESQWSHWVSEQKQKGVVPAYWFDRGPPKLEWIRSIRHGRVAKENGQEFVPNMERLNRWNLGITASTGMASA